MNYSFNAWNKINTLSLDKVVDMVITNGTVHTIKSDTWLLQYMGEESSRESILDFGSGVGRNIFDFSSKRTNWEFVGYDNPSMIEKSNEYLRVTNRTFPTNVCLTDDWESLRLRKFSCVYATLVFQHILEDDLNRYLSDIKSMTTRLIVSGRRFNDDLVDGSYKNTWEILEKCGFYPSNAKKINYTSQGHPDEHTTCIYKICQQPL
jgi:hypothetical protein